ncbi:helix-turn-helix domain-containing protein [Craterilacuibacter sp.]|uniref:helix-turn-helix domain-containing protein n=1 Tax=Craterilacuibacter sp. TaxID=2870909 RepID=UPI003F374B0C
MTVLPVLESPDFPSALKNLRKELQLSRTALADKVGLSTAAIQRYEATDNSHITPSPQAYERLVRALADQQVKSAPVPAARIRQLPAIMEAPPRAEQPPPPLPAILLTDATLEQLIARAKILGAKKVTIEF